MQQLVQRLVEFTAQCGRLLHGAPTHVQMRDRLRECRECNSVERAHVCPFPQPQGLAVGSAGQQQGAPQPPQQPRPAPSPASGSAQPAGAAAAGSSPPRRASAAAPAAAPAKSPMCRSWQKTKTCPRMQSGQRCSHAHPTDHVQPHCFAFAKHGSCPRRDNCRFPHIAAEQLHSPPPAAASSSRVPPVAPARADGAVAAMEMSDADSAPAPDASAAAAPAAAVAAAAAADAPAPRAAPSDQPNVVSSAAASSALQRSSSVSAPTSNLFAALAGSDGAVPKQPTVAPSTPVRSRSSVAAPATPVSSLSALASPSTHTLNTASKKRKVDHKAAGGKSLRRSLASDLAAEAVGPTPKQGSSTPSL